MSMDTFMHTHTSRKSQERGCSSVGHCSLILLWFKKNITSLMVSYLGAVRTALIVIWALNFNLFMSSVYKSKLVMALIGRSKKRCDLNFGLDHIHIKGYLYIHPIQIFASQSVCFVRILTMVMLCGLFL